VQTRDDLCRQAFEPRSWCCGSANPQARRAARGGDAGTGRVWTSSITSTAATERQAEEAFISRSRRESCDSRVARGGPCASASTATATVNGCGGREDQCRGADRTRSRQTQLFLQAVRRHRLNRLVPRLRIVPMKLPDEHADTGLTMGIRHRSGPRLGGHEMDGNRVTRAGCRPGLYARALLIMIVRWVSADGGGVRVHERHWNHGGAAVSPRGGAGRRQA